MVLLATYFLDSALSLIGGAGRRAIQLKTLTNLTLQNIFFNLCKACQARTMSFMPPTAFSAGRIRETQRDDRNMKLSNTTKGRAADSAKYFNTTSMELNPLKYNSKLMNSIWGFYNRYSPHNVKKINDVFSFNVECQQSAGSSTTKNEPVMTVPSPKINNAW